MKLLTIDKTPKPVTRKDVEDWGLGGDSIDLNKILNAKNWLKEQIKEREELDIILTPKVIYGLIDEAFDIE